MDLVLLGAMFESDTKVALNIIARLINAKFVFPSQTSFPNSKLS